MLTRTTWRGIVADRYHFLPPGCGYTVSLSLQKVSENVTVQRAPLILCTRCILICSYVMLWEKVCVEPPPGLSALNVTLPAFAAERHLLISAVRCARS